MLRLYYVHMPKNHQDNEYERRERQFEVQVLYRITDDWAVIAVDVAEHPPEADCGISRYFERADNRMYENKSSLKWKLSSGPQGELRERQRSYHT